MRNQVSVLWLFATRYRYEFTYVDVPDRDEECFVCKEPYSKAHGRDDRCVAVRLNSCGHIVGLQCFHQWVKRVPNTCIHWTHELPGCKSKFEESKLYKFATFICFTSWFTWLVAEVDRQIQLEDSWFNSADLRVAFQSFKRLELTADAARLIWAFHLTQGIEYVEYVTPIDDRARIEIA
ncbi:hypothetical protein T440DRAFT_479824 [Plenodomus tracheiphilus IPT5]|uniref:RING-type domain-containing protein n=1 Tax=Plenodomus tracheiphilus IPT5 TaxID=1408161 RepID=A0A6A7B2Y8_9PLEO|nr:hypothetical protein T440DRAFT_479824 [Plenodomus tracheiphilus IPT5]